MVKEREEAQRKLQEQAQEAARRAAALAEAGGSGTMMANAAELARQAAARIGTEPVAKMALNCGSSPK